MNNLFGINETTTGARFSDCGKYRYSLWRQWSDGDGTCCFIMLNPSTADDVRNDPTVERCERRARMWGYSRLVVVNLFAFRATDPRDMKAAIDPVGPYNHETILREAMAARLVVCAWGRDGCFRNRDADVLSILRRYDVPLTALKVSKDGRPYHPLYLPYELTPAAYDGKELRS